MKRACLTIGIALLALVVLADNGSATKLFQPAYDFVSISDSSTGAHASVTQHIEVPASDHLPAFLKFILPSGQDVIPVQINAIIGTGQFEVDVGCDSVPDIYSLTTFEAGVLMGDPPSVETNWVAQGYPFQQFTFKVKGSRSAGQTLEAFLFAVGPPVCPPMVLDLTWDGVSSDNPATTTVNEAGDDVLTNPNSSGVYTWSVEFKSKPLSDPPEHLITRCDQVGIGGGVVTDTDGDGIPDSCDNCPSTINADQRDFDLDDIGDVCDGDDDNDGVANGSDLCPQTGPPGSPEAVDINGCSAVQVDQDQDGICDPGKTSSFCTDSDNCPGIYNPGQEDWNTNGVGDHCEDSDGDLIADVFDNCPGVANGLNEFEIPGVGNQLDTDIDDVGDACDNCPSTANGPAEAGIPGVGDQLDTDGDSLGDACDPDDDDDGLLDGVDPCPALLDCDGDGWTDWTEVTFIGTDAADACPDDTLDDAWPVDSNNDTFINSADLSAVASVIGQAVPPAPARNDIDPDPPDQLINSGDLSQVAAVIGQGCV